MSKAKYIAKTVDVSGNLTTSNTINLGGVTISSANGVVSLPANTKIGTAQLPPVNLNIVPEVLTIQTAATEPGDAIRWFWTWQTSTLPYARSTITNSFQTTVPLYKLGTYTINNFAANEQYGDMTQTHHAYFKWINGSGIQNKVSWAVEGANVNVTHPDIHGGQSTSVQRYIVSVPSSITPPTLVAPIVSYDISLTTPGEYIFGGAAEGINVNIGPMYVGGTYTFNLGASIADYPFYLTTDNGQSFVSGSYVGEYTTGVTGSRNNGSAGQTTLVFVVPEGAPSTLYYQCGVNGSMRGVITIKPLAVDVNNNGNYIIYYQHTHEGHETPIEIRPIPSLVNQMCLVYEQASGTFVPQDLATYVENTPSFRNKIQEVAGTATLIDASGAPIVATVKIFADAAYLTFSGNKPGDIAYTQDNNTLYIWDETVYNWISTKPQNTTELAEGTNLYYTNTRVGTYLSNNGIYASASDYANTGINNAASASLYANTKVSKSGDTITGPVIISDTGSGALQVAGTVTISQDLNVTGNIFLSGTATTISSNNLTLSDPLIYLAVGNIANTADIGIVGHVTNGHYYHTGMVRDHLDGTWKFFSNVTSEPSTTINFGEANTVYDVIRVGGIVSPSALINGRELGAYTQASFNKANTAVTSVAGTGTVNGLTLSGTVTSSGSLTLGGTLALGSLNTLGTAAGLSATLAVASGGTGVTTSTGTGNNVLSTSPTLVTPIISSPTISGNGLVNTSWTTAGRPASPVTGQQGFNATTGFAEYWTGTIWSSYGSITPSSVNYLIVAGGGGAATDADVGGGGGGGGLITGFQTVVSGSSYTITVGGGGAGGTTSYTPGTGGGGNGSQGGNSSFIGLTAIGGGYGGTRYQPGGNGGSGGGGGDGGASGGSGTSGQGYNGGTAPAMNANAGWDEGGGGGAGGAGNSWLPGPGLSSSISGSSVTYAAGGRGAAPSAQPVNSGNGGNSMTAGASGVVIIAYSNIYKLATVSGSVTQTNVGGNYIYTFTGSGTITF